jgi:ATP phosphoribosyltransferase regulatory subunit
MAIFQRYPAGAAPLLIEETARRKRMESRIVALLEDGGFAEVVLPIIDFAEPYAGLLQHDAAKRSYRFTDRDGELVAIRSDFTPMVARALAPSLDGNLPLRVFYRGDVIRCGDDLLGAGRELFQIGAEIVGDPSAEADTTMLRLAADVAAAAGVSPVVVCSGERLRSSLDERFVFTDDGRESRDGYYTGLRFWVYASDRRTLLAQGGRYDTLYERFGASAPAVGFTLTLDRIGERGGAA